jgi:hypothetical protein
VEVNKVIHYVITITAEERRQLENETLPLLKESPFLTAIDEALDDTELAD